MEQLTKTYVDNMLDDPHLAVPEFAQNVDRANQIINCLKADKSGKFLRSNGLNADPTFEDVGSTASIADNSIQLSKIVHGTSNTVLGYNSSGVLVEVYPASIVSNLPANSVDLSKLATQNVTDTGKVLQVNQAEVIQLGTVSSGSMSAANLLHIKTTKDKNVHGGNAINGWNQRELNTTVLNNITGCTVSNNLITLPAGTYYVEGSAVTHASGSTCLVLGNLAQSTIYVRSFVNYVYGNTSASAVDLVSGFFTLSTGSSVGLFQFCSQPKSPYGLGMAGNISFGTLSMNEVYGDYKIWKV